MRKAILTCAVAALVAAPILAQHEGASATERGVGAPRVGEPGGVQGTPPIEAIDYNAIYKIKAEGLGNRSQVMDTLSWLTDVHGPRLTNSPGMRAAAEWAKSRLEQWGFSNVQLAPWGPFGRGWENERLQINMIAPRPFEMLGYPKAWSPGTNGPVTAEVVHVPLNTQDDLKKAAGTLKGKIVLVGEPRDLDLLWNGVARRFSEQDLKDMESD